VFANKRT